MRLDDVGSKYSIAGNFYMVQMFALFAGGLATVKIRTAKVCTSENFHTVPWHMQKEA